MNNKLTAISLFTGAGGMDIGFEAAGFNVVFANEIIKEAAETYRANHPGCNMFDSVITLTNNKYELLCPEDYAANVSLLQELNNK